MTASLSMAGARVLIHLTARGTGGVETHSRELAMALSGASASVYVTSQRELNFDQVSQQRMLEGGIKLLAPPRPRPSLAPIDRWRSLQVSRSYLEKHIEPNSFDLVIGQGHGAALSWTRRYLRPGGRLIWHEYWYGVPTRGDRYASFRAPQGERFGPMMRHMVRSVDAIVTGCVRSKVNLVEVQRIRCPIDVIPPLDSFMTSHRAKNRRYTRDAPLKVVMVGRQGRGKGTLALLNVWSELNLPNAELHIYGGASDPYVRDSLMKASADAKSVFWHGSFLSEDLEKILTSADLGLFTSVEEGYGLVACEYMAAGLPFVMTDVGASHEFGEGNPDCIVSAVDTASLMRAIREAVGSLRDNRLSRSRLQRFYLSRFHHQWILDRHLRYLIGRLT